MRAQRLDAEIRRLSRKIGDAQATAEAQTHGSASGRHLVFCSRWSRSRMGLVRTPEKVLSFPCPLLSGAAAEYVFAASGAKDVAR